MRPDEGSPPDGWGEPRSRTVTWWDPMIGAHAMHDLSGREYLQAMIDGRLPPAPIGGLMAMTAVSVGEGTAASSARSSTPSPVAQCTARCRREWATRVWRSRSAICARSGMVEAS